MKNFAILTAIASLMAMPALAQIGGAGPGAVPGTGTTVAPAGPAGTTGGTTGTARGSQPAPVRSSPQTGTTQVGPDGTPMVGPSGAPVVKHEAREPVIDNREGAAPRRDIKRANTDDARNRGDQASKPDLNRPAKSMAERRNMEKKSAQPAVANREDKPKDLGDTKIEARKERRAQVNEARKNLKEDGDERRQERKEDAILQNRVNPVKPGQQ